MKKVNINFIPQNIAPVGAKKIAIFDSNGNKVDSLPLGNLSPKSSGSKLYSFGALSDVHLPYATQHASSDFQKALTYFNNVAHVDFICIAGDISDAGTEAEWLDYKNHVDTYSPNIPVHMCTGNHDTADDITYEYPIQYTGHPLWYSFTQGDDVFIFFGLRKWQGNDVFYDEALQWLYETLEENKDKRCFVFQHEMRLDGCGNAHGLYGWDGLAGKNGQVFLSLMEHYKNVIWFHGHSHTPFRLQSVQPTPIANYDRLHGCHSVHIPSLAIPRYGNSDVIFDAEGYIVDVYENGVHLRGIDFIEEEFVPIASYWIDTTPVDIPVESYTDATGTIKKKAITLPKDSELYLNQRYSYSGKGLTTENGMFTVFIPTAGLSGSCTVSIKNSLLPLNTNTSGSSSVIYALDSTKGPLAYINGSLLPTMTEGITYSEDYKSADIKFVIPDTCAYIALSLDADNSASITAADIKEYIIEIEGEEVGLPEEVLKYTNLVPISIDSDGSIYNNIGYKNDSYVSTDGTVKDNTGTLATGYIKTNSNIFYIFGAEFALNTYSRLKLYDENFNTLSTQIIADNTSMYETEDIGNGITKLTFNVGNSHEYVRFNLYGTGENLYVYTMNNENEIVLPEGSELYINQRYSQSGGGLTTTDATGCFAVIMPIDASATYTLSISNASSTYLNTQGTTLYRLDANKACLGNVNGSNYPCDMVDGVTFGSDNESVTILFSSTSDTKYMAFTTRLTTSEISEESLKDIVITLEKVEVEIETSEPKEITSSVTWTADTRLSSSDGSYKTQAGVYASNDILVKNGDVIRFYGADWSYYAYINAYSDSAFLINACMDSNDTVTNEFFTATKDDNNVLTVTITKYNVSYIRVCCDGIAPVNMRVSINKELNSYDFNGDYDEPHWFEAYISSDTGQVNTSDTGYATTAFLRYNKQNTYTFTVTEALVPYRVFFYDSSKTFISCTDQSDNLTCAIGNAPIGTAYFRFRGNYSNNNGTFGTAISNVTYNITQRPTYNVTNLVSTSQSVDSTAVYNGVGYKDNAYISTSTKAEETVNGHALTGLIPYTITKESAPTIYIRGVELPDSDTYVRFTLYNSEKTVLEIMHTTAIQSTYFTKETLGDKYYKFTPAYAASTGNTRLSNITTGNAYISLGGKGFGEGLIVTFDEPIEEFFTDLLQTQDVQLNKRWSSSSNAYVSADGAIAFSVPFSDIDGKTIKLIGFPEEHEGISTWYAYKDGAVIGRIANPGSGTIWTSSELINNGDGSYDIPISTQIFKDINRTDTPISDIPDTIYITMHVGLFEMDAIKVLLVSNLT